jgi:hypothetical protein
MLFDKKCSMSITGLKYQHISCGPVPVRYDWIYGESSEFILFLQKMIMEPK